MTTNEVTFPQSAITGGTELTQTYHASGGGGPNMRNRKKGGGYQQHQTNMQSKSKIGLKWGFDGLERKPPAWPANKNAIVINNHTPDLMQDWSFWSFLFYFFSIIATTAAFSFTQATAYALLNDDTNFGHVAVRSFIVLGIVFILVAAFGRWTGAYLNPWISTVVTITWIIFGRDHEDHKRASVWYELLKWVFVMVAQFIGFLIGIALIALWSTGGASTSDCAIDTVAACDALPDLGAGIGQANAAWMELFAGIFICMGYALGHTLHGDNRKNINWIIAVLVSLSYGIMHLLFGAFAGGSYNIHYWLVLALYTRDFSNAVVYTWSFLVGCVVVFIFQAIHYWVSNRVRAKAKAEKNEGSGVV